MRRNWLTRSILSNRLESINHHIRQHHARILRHSDDVRMLGGDVLHDLPDTKLAHSISAEFWEDLVGDARSQGDDLGGSLGRREGFEEALSNEECAADV